MLYSLIKGNAIKTSVMNKYERLLNPHFLIKKTITKVNAENTAIIQAVRELVKNKVINIEKDIKK